MPTGVFTRTPAHREKMRNVALKNGNRPPSPRGTVWTDERKEKLAAKRRGIPRPDHVKAKMAPTQFKKGVPSPDKGKTRPEFAAEKNPFWKGGTSQLFKLKTATRPKPLHCEVCNASGDKFKRGLCFDHDHDTGKFRGWLCTRCNVALGMVGDSIEMLGALIVYLSSHDKGA